MNPELELPAWAVALTFFQKRIAAAGKTNPATLAGAQIFFWARFAYAAIYLAGIPWLRTAVWFVSVVGLATIFAQLF